MAPTLLSLRNASELAPLSGWRAQLRAPVWILALGGFGLLLAGLSGDIYPDLNTSALWVVRLGFGFSFLAIVLALSSRRVFPIHLFDLAALVAGYVLTSNCSNPQTGVLLLMAAVLSGTLAVAIGIRDREFSDLALGGLSVLLGIALFPSLMDGPCRISNSAAAIANIRSISTAQVTFASAHGGSYGSVKELITEGLIDPRFENVVSGYTFTIALTDRDYTTTANPISRDAGRWGYFSRSDAIVLYQSESTETCRPCFPEGMAGAPVSR